MQDDVMAERMKTTGFAGDKYPNNELKLFKNISEGMPWRCKSFPNVLPIYHYYNFGLKSHCCFALLVDFLVVVAVVAFLAPPPALPPREF